jgi:hypothetical protein
MGAGLLDCATIYPHANPKVAINKARNTRTSIRYVRSEIGVIPIYIDNNNDFGLLYTHYFIATNAM